MNFLGILVELKKANPSKDGDAKPPIYGKTQDSGVASVRIVELDRFELPVSCRQLVPVRQTMPALQSNLEQRDVA